MLIGVDPHEIGGFAAVEVADLEDLLF